MSGTAGFCYFMAGNFCARLYDAIEQKRLWDVLTMGMLMVLFLTAGAIVDA